jgi:tRNA dimethylallyltransferase
MGYEIKKNKILVICGATASGKSALALKMALARNGVIINADALQQYCELPILSAQPTKDDLQTVPHCLYSVLKHNENSSVASWLNKAINQINLAFKNGKLPILVGGTGLYLSKLVDGINKVPEIGENLREEVRKISSREDLIENLIYLGEEKKIIAKLDKQRLARRLEVLKQTGKTLSWWQEQPNEVFYPKEYFEVIKTNLPREILYKNCNERLAAMFESGALQEVKALLEAGLKDNSTIAKTIGFLEIKDYLAGKITKNQALEIASQKTRNYAKRQLTWFNNQFKNN